MARKRMVTRTVKTTKAVIMCVDTAKERMFEQEVILPQMHKSPDMILKAARPKIETDGVKAVHVKSVEYPETLYGMPEEKFIAESEILPPRFAAGTDEEYADEQGES